MRDLRTYITGMGSSGALLGAILIAFATLAGIVAFTGMPGGSEEPTGVGNDVFVRADPAPEAPARADRSRRPTPDRSPPRGGGRRPATGGDPGGSPAGVAVAPSGNAPPVTQDPDPPSRPDPPQHPNPTPPTLPPLPSQEGDVGDLVLGVDETVAGATGIDSGFGPAMKPVTDPVDHVIKGLTGGGLGLGEVDVVDPLKAVGG